MIGLCAGLAAQAWIDYHGTPQESDDIRRDALWQIAPAILTRERIASCSTTAFPISRRYYRLLDLCPLRMS